MRSESEQGSNKHAAASEAGADAKRRRTSEDNPGSSVAVEDIPTSPADATVVSEPVRGSVQSPISVQSSPSAPPDAASQPARISNPPGSAADTAQEEDDEAELESESDLDIGKLRAIAAGGKASSSDESSDDDEALAKPTPQAQPAAASSESQPAASSVSKPAAASKPYTGGIADVLADLMSGGESDSDKEEPVANLAKPKGGKSGKSSSSSDSDSESSSSTSSSSSSAAPDDQAVAQVTEEVEEDTEQDEEITESPEDLRMRGVQAMRRIHIKRDEILKMLFQLPREEAYRAIEGSFVRITLGNGCVMAEVTECVSTDKKYKVRHPKGHDCNIDITLRCKRATADHCFKICVVSNQDFTDDEFNNWRKVTHAKTVLDLEHFIPRWTTKVSSIVDARNFTWNEARVTDLLKNKKAVYRMQAVVETVGTVDGLRRSHVRCERECKEQKLRLKYSLREINNKNKDRQTARDKYALNYTYKNEASGDAGLNPFERRACRPVTAWDVKISNPLGNPEPQQAPAQDAKKGDDAAKAAAKPAPEKTDVNGVGKEPAAATTEVDKMTDCVKAHRSVNRLLQDALRNLNLGVG